MKQIKKIIVTVLVILPFSVFGQENNFKSAMDSVFQAMFLKDYSLLKPLLTSDAKLGNNLPSGMNDQIIPQVIKQLPKPNSYKIIQIEKEGDNSRVFAEFYTDIKTLHHDFLFNKENKILELNILKDVKTNVKEIKTNKFENEVLPLFMEVPFQLKKNIIILDVYLNGEKVKFVLDSGAPMLIVNTNRYSVKNKSEQNKSKNKYKGVNGDINNVDEFILDSLKWANMNLKNVSALGINLKHLEKELNTKIYGLIGYDIIKNYEITFDYQNKRVTLIKVDSTGERLYSEYSPGQQICVQPIKMIQHIPVIDVVINNKNYSLAIDCGASVDLFYSQMINEFDLKGKVKTDKLIGAENIQKEVKSATIKSYIICNLNFENIKTSFDDESLNQLNDGYNLKVSGILGYEFLKQHKVSINFIKEEIKFYK